MIRVEQLSKHFGAIKAVDGISFEVRDQETLILLGTSGCGKTTTLKMINRLIGGIEQVELQLRRSVESKDPGSVRSGASQTVPPGYVDAVAEYFRRLSQQK